MSKINVLNKEVAFYTHRDEDFISLTDIARYKAPNAPADVVKNWTRRKDTIEFLGLWERINNENFKLVEFDQLKNQAGVGEKWITAKKIITKFWGLTNNGRNKC